MRFDRALRAVRAAKGLSQKDLAARAGYNPSYISHLESGARRPSATAISKIAEALDIPETVLLLLGASRGELLSISEKEAAVVGREILQALAEPSRG